MQYENRSAESYEGPTPQESETAARTRTRLKLVLTRLGVALLAMMVTSRVGQLCFTGIYRRFWLLLSPAAFLLLDILVYALTMLVPLWLLLESSGGRSSGLLPLRRVPARQLLPSLFISLGISTFANLLSNLFSFVLEDGLGLWFEVYEPSFPVGFWPVLLSFFSVAVAPAILEELLFRGAVLQSLRPFGDRFAIVLSSVLFAVCHTTVRQLLPAFFIGLCLSYFAVRTGSLWTGVCVHLVYNGCSALLTYLLARFGPGLQGTVSFLLFLVYIAGMAAGLVSLFSQFGPHALRLLPDPKTVPSNEKLRLIATNPALILGVAAFVVTTLATIRAGGDL